MNIDDLIRKAARGTLEVEHLLQAAVARLPELRVELQQLVARHDWRTAAECETTRYVPLATWASVAGAYAEGGLAALRTFTDKHPTFCIALLEELRSEAAVDALLSWWPGVMSSPEAERTLAWRIAAALNLVLSFKQAPEISVSCRNSVRQFAYRLYLVADTEAHRAKALLMLRGVGDEQSLAFVSGTEEFGGAWADTKRIVMRAIRRRLDGANKRVQATRSKQRAPDA
jgi:hypothetical protein